MLADDRVEFIINSIRKQVATGGVPNYSVVRDAVFKKYFEQYSAKLIENIYNKEKDNPKFKLKEAPKPYFDTKKAIKETGE